MIEKNSLYDRAIVIGASISGLLAARVLAKHYTQVTIIERDTFPILGMPRKGVPQGRHAHVLLASGLLLLEQYFPGLTGELSAKGALACDLSETSLWYSAGAYTTNFHSGLMGMQVSRPLLEGTIAQRVKALHNVNILEKHDASGLLTQPRGTNQELCIRGVRIVDRSQAEPEEITISADLVVDAGGRGSRILTWLESLGYARPAEEQIKVNLTYTTREFARLPEHAGGRSPVVILASPSNRRGAAMLAVEGERWIVTLAGILGEAAPPDLEGFIEFARSLDAPDCYEVIRSAEPLGEASQYKYPASLRRRFENLSRFPDGLLVCGDVLCSFNPIYGQGMTTAAMEAKLLDDCLSDPSLRGSPGRMRRQYFSAASRLLDSPWSISAGSDLAYPEVEGKRSPLMRLVGLYLERLLVKSREDHTLNLAFQRVTNLIDPPEALFQPRIIKRVLFG